MEEIMEQTAQQEAQTPEQEEQTAHTLALEQEVESLRRESTTASWPMRPPPCCRSGASIPVLPPLCWGTALPPPEKRWSSLTASTPPPCESI